MSIRAIWAIGAIAFALLGFILMVSPTAIMCSSEVPVRPIQLLEAISAGYTCANGYPIEAFASSALASFALPFIGSAACLVFYLASKSQSKAEG